MPKPHTAPAPTKPTAQVIDVTAATKRIMANLDKQRDEILRLRREVRLALG
jgi:hypothetical protein